MQFASGCFLSISEVCLYPFFPGIDYTMSNKIQGEKTFGGLSLHDTTSQKSNPYQEVKQHPMLSCVHPVKQLRAALLCSVVFRLQTLINTISF